MEAPLFVNAATKPTILGESSAAATLGSTPSPFSSGILGSNSTSSSFSFAAAVKESGGNETAPPKSTNSNVTPGEANKNESTPASGFWKSQHAFSFVSIASSRENNIFRAQKNEGSGFFGLTKKEDICTKFAKKKASGRANESTEEDANA